MDENRHICESKHDLTLGAKLNKWVENMRKYAGMPALLCLLLMMMFIACKSESKVVDSNKNLIKLSKKVEDLRQQIARDDYIGTEFIARKQEVDSAYLRKQELMRIATEDELIELTGDPNPVVSLTAFQGLYNRGSTVVPIIFNGYKSRTDHIRFVRGDLMMDISLLQYAYIYVMHYEMPDDEFISQTPEDTPKFELSEKEQEEVVRIIDRLR